MGDEKERAVFGFLRGIQGEWWEGPWFFRPVDYWEIELPNSFWWWAGACGGVSSWKYSLNPDCFRQKLSGGVVRSTECSVAASWL